MKVNCFLIALLSLWCALSAHAQRIGSRLEENGHTDLGTATPKKFVGIGIHEKLGTQVDGNLHFKDSSGKKVTVNELLSSGKPVLLTLNYFTCESLCNIQLNALVTGLKGMDLLPGKDFTLATVSIDHRNNSELAASKRTAYLNSLARPNADWKFLTGEQEQIVKLAGSVGFEYKYDPETDQFAHNAAVFFISPKGVVSRYLYGIQYNPRDIKFSLMEASEGKLGSVKDKLLLNCFHYDELTGKYTSMVLKIMRMAGIVTATGLALWLGFLWRREAIRKASDLKLELLKSNRKESFVS